MRKFTIQQFNEKYKTDDDCLSEIFSNRYATLKICPNKKCKKETRFHKVSDRKCYACQYCGYQLHPLGDTIFHKSDTSLKSWFFAIFLFANSRNGVSSKELERQLGVTYKTAWRIGKQVRKLFKAQEKQMLSKVVEADETYIGGRRHNAERMSNKSAVVAMVQRGGKVYAVSGRKLRNIGIKKTLLENIDLKAHLMTDQASLYKKVGRQFKKHGQIRHDIGQYVKGDVHTNTVEGFFSHLKRGISGTYASVSPKHLQSYVNEFAYRYNRGNYGVSLFYPMISRAGKPA